MTTQTAEKAARTRKEPSGPSHEEIHATYQCHTLAQFLYSQILANHPWLAPAPNSWSGPPLTAPSGVRTTWPDAGEPMTWGL